MNLAHDIFHHPLLNGYLSSFHDCGSNVDFALHVASQNCNLQVVDYLLSHGANIESKIFGGFTPLHVASYQNHLPVVEYLISHGANIESKTKEGYTPLHIASFNNHLPIVEYLISHGANIECKKHNGLTPLAIAASKIHLSVVDCLISYGACICKTSNFDVNSTHWHQKSLELIQKQLNSI